MGIFSGKSTHLTVQDMNQGSSNTESKKQNRDRPGCNKEAVIVPTVELLINGPQNCASPFYLRIHLLTWKQRYIEIKRRKTGEYQL